MVTDSIPLETVVVESTSSSWSDRLINNLKANPYFNAGAGLAGMGLAMGALRRFAIIGNTLFRRRFVLTLNITNEDPAFPWILDFINKRSSTRTRNLSVSTVVRQAESGKTALAVSFLPGQGQHLFVHDWRTREKEAIQRNGIRTPLETVTLSTFGTDVTFLKKLVDQATSEALSQSDTGLTIYQAVGPQWVRFGLPRRKRDVDSVILEGNNVRELVGDFQEFLDSSKWYSDRGVPYRRGYLFYGPPGTGKSSFITALASHFGYSVCMLSLSEITLDDDRLNHLINTAPPNSVVVLEDVDATSISREAAQITNHPAYAGMTRVTLSGLLNAIDGVGSAEERILFMTTNHVERLDKALIRPGRVDKKVYFGHASDEMIAKMFLRFYGNVCTSEESTRFVSACRALGRDISPAQIQGHFLLFKHDSEAAICHASEMITELRS